MRIWFLPLFAGAIKLRSGSSFANPIVAMSIDELTQRLIASNQELFDVPTQNSTDADISSMDRQDRNVNLPRAINITSSNQDYLDELWNWVKGDPGGMTRGYLPYILQTTRYLNEYVYRRTADPSDSTNPNVAGDIIVDPSWEPNYPISWSIWNTSQPILVYFDSNNTCLKAILNEAMMRFQEVTNSCIRFAQASTNSKGVLQVTSYNNGCYATLGQRDEGNILNLGSGCQNVGTVMHLLGHVLGMAHEDQRPDAEQYVAVIPENIDVYGMSSSSDIDPTTAAKYQFFFTPLNGTKTEWEKQIVSLPYEYGSLMHNSKNVYAVDIARALTITGRSSNVFDDLMGNRGYLTERDGRLLNEMYSCSRVPLKVIEREFSRPIYPGLTFEMLNQCLISDSSAASYLVSRSI